VLDDDNESAVERGATMSMSLQEIRRRADAGDSTAQYQLGNVLQQGLFEQPVDLAGALDCYRRAAAGGHRDALFNIGLIGLRILPARGERSHCGEAARALEQAVDGGDGEAMMLLGEELISGDGGLATDPQRGVALLQAAANAGHPAAFSRLGRLYLDGRHLQADPAAAVDCFRRGAEAGDPEGQLNLGICLHRGLGVAVDRQTASALFQRAAEAGHADAMVNLAATLVDGSVGPADLQAATHWIIESARRGSADGLFEAGQAFREGRGLPQDLAQAAACYQGAARQGHPEALFALGRCFEHGIGVEVDLAQAEQCYQRATMQGHGGAAHNLGIMFIKGIGVERNPRMARELFEYSVACGEDDAMFSLGLVSLQEDDAASAYMWALLSCRHRPQGQGRALLDRAAGDLSDLQRSIAQARADQWTRPDKLMAFHDRSPA
jgi:uncharacterized protein